MNAKTLASSAALLLLGLMSGTASAGFIEWTDWTSSPTSTTVLGKIGSIDVTYTGNFSFVQTGPECTNYWTEPNASSLPYTGNPVIDNAPTACEMVALNIADSHTISFSEEILNPVMAIVSLGRNSERWRVTYDFDTAFTILSNGQGYWGAGTAVTGEVHTLTGYEFHGAIQFDGAVSSLSWTSLQSENWHGFTFGRATSVPEPGTLALLGLGLAGMGLATRRKKV